MVTAIIPAAGLGLRLKSSIPKPLVKIGQKPILIYTLTALAKSSLIKNFLIAAPNEYIERYKNALDKYRIRKRVDLVIGGLTRKDSVENCLKEAPADTDIVLIHDAARPFVSKELIDQLLEAARKNKAVICGVPVKATIKRAKSKGQRANGIFVERTLNRDNLWEIQTPQVFSKDLILEAYERYGFGSVTDDASLVEQMGVRIKVILGSYFNIKITTPEDLIFAEAILKSRRWITELA